MKLLRKCIAVSFVLPLIALSSNAESYLRCSDYVPPPDTFVAAGSTYYVNINDSLASDTLDGSAPTYVSGTVGPWRTIQKATSTMTAGDITYIKEGIYYETNITFNNSGTASAPIVLSAYGSLASFDSVVIDGSLNPDWAAGILLQHSQSNIVIQGLTIQNMTRHGIKSDEGVVAPYKNITIREVTVRYNGDDFGMGIWLIAVDSFKIDNVTAYGNHNDGISVAGFGTSMYSENGYFVNCVSYDNDDFEPPASSDAHGIAINQGRNIAICNCEAYGNRDHGIDVSDWPKGDSLSHHITLENNVSHNNDNSGFAINSDSHHILFLRNLSYENITGFWGYSGVGHLEFYHNVAVRNKYEGFLVDSAYAVYENPGDSSLIFKNNITYNNDTLGWTYALYVQGNKYQVMAEYNNFQVRTGQTGTANVNYTTYTPSTIGSLGPGNVSKDPGFVAGDISPPDIHLLPTSEMIDSGTVIFINGMPESYIGTAPDMGVYEYEAPYIDEYTLENKKNTVNIYPSPSNDYFTIEIDSEVFQTVAIKLYNVLGQEITTLINQKPLPQGFHSFSLNISDLAVGIYYLSIRIGEDKTTRKIIVIR